MLSRNLLHSCSNIASVFRKEWSAYFNTQIGYLFTIFYLFLSSFLFFYGLGEESFWERKVAGMEEYFIWTPLLFTVFIPALTMRLWSEEKRSGTLELLFTLPLGKSEITFGKFLAAWAFLGFVLSLTLPIPFSIWALSDLDLGIVFAGYLGCYLLGGAYLSLGTLLSSLGKDQISSYILTLFVCLFFFLLGTQPVLKFLGGGFAGLASFLSLGSHFESFRLGLVDGGDAFYFLSFILANLFSNVFLLRRDYP
ncbi:gliding motility ABC transporter [Leptospira langatensis]|uniref:Gliding motility ABC transporter n=1 Tax=Leptospira langatensis TaxID=2484983 RepID=A0A5F1ZRH9_9LEPT|nr:ABC transporter permease subunit [Leptospira langatensis]TGK05554.1 gliding motility ABC transporter [Leptospira langatensis]TGL38686.1 gliding motility ABC transporter [Leptospira langatensis]